jgi:predicted HicB family RNase H-like nuclease
MIICTGIMWPMTQTKRPRGRPPLENPETERYELRLSPDRLARYAAAAERAGKTIAAWMKAVLDRASKR